MITKETAEAIWSAHREIETAEKLKAEMAELQRQHGEEKDAPKLSDTWGRRQYLHLGVPCGENAHRLFRVPNALVPYCLDAHLAQQRKDLADACVKARMELDGVAGAASAQPHIDVSDADWRPPHFRWTDGPGSTLEVRDGRGVWTSVPNAARDLLLCVAQLLGPYVSAQDDYLAHRAHRALPYESVEPRVATRARNYVTAFVTALPKAEASGATKPPPPPSNDH